MSSPTTPPDTLDRAQKAQYSALRKLLCSAERETVLHGLELLQTLADPVLLQTFGSGIAVVPTSSDSDGTMRVSIGRWNGSFRDNTAWVGWHVREEHRHTVALVLARAMGLLEPVERLDLGYNVWSVAALEGLPLLRELGIGNANGIDSLRGLSRLPLLERLSFVGFSFSSLEGLHALPALRSLSFYACEELGDVSALAGLGGLRELRLSRSPLLRRLDMLSGLSSLEQLDLRDMPSLEDIGFVAGLPALRELDLSECPAVRSWTPLAAATRLETLRLYKASIDDLSPLAGLTALKLLSLSDCKGVRDLRPLLNLAALEKLETSGCSLLPGSFQSSHNAEGVRRLFAGLRDGRERVRSLVERLVSQDPRTVARAFRTLSEDPDLAAHCAPLLAEALEAQLAVPASEGGAAGSPGLSGSSA